MIDEIITDNSTDIDGNPTGGHVVGTGMKIDWQEGPLGRGENRIEPNGAFVETVIVAAKQRLVFYQDSKFNCIANAMAITKLDEALMWCNRRTQDRDERDVEGTHEV